MIGNNLLLSLGGFDGPFAASLTIIKPIGVQGPVFFPSLRDFYWLHSITIHSISVVLHTAGY